MRSKSDRSNGLKVQDRTKFTFSLWDSDIELLSAPTGSPPGLFLLTFRGTGAAMVEAAPFRLTPKPVS
jgi:hypothetical protein